MPAWPEYARETRQSPLSGAEANPLRVQTMSSTGSPPRFRLYYWPIPFRGCFVSYLFAYRDAPLLEQDGLEENADLKNRKPSEQDIPYMGPPLPYMGPPLLRDLESGRALSQMPAIVMYVSRQLDLVPQDPFDAALCMKVLMDCNDVLMEICRYNGSSMWTREEEKYGKLYCGGQIEQSIRKMLAMDAE